MSARPRHCVVGGWGRDGIGGRGTIVPMALNYTQQMTLAIQWNAAENPS